MKIFLGIIGNVGYYPTARDCGDLMGHTANAPCSVCAFGRRKATSNGQPVHTSNTHRKFLPFVRLNERMEEIRSDGPLNADLRTLLGFKCETQEQDSRKYKIMTENALYGGRSPKISVGREVVSTLFDSYLITIILPDNLLT